MIVTFLGTGTSQGVPVIGCDCPVCCSLDFRDQRFRASIRVEVDDQSIVVDTGPDFRMQMLRERIRKLDAVLFTHEHKDHTAGLDDVRSFNFLQKRDMPIYGRNTVIENIRNEYHYAFAEKRYPGVPSITTNDIDGPFKVGGVEITPIDVLHYKLPVHGYRIWDFVYITDAKTIEESEIDKIRGCEVLVLNALQREPHISHFTLQEALEFIKLIKPKQAYLTHLSHKMGKHKDLEEELPEGVSVAYDGLKISI